jgi:rhamnose utilization protein RhaD (predicted bifunctional aldolase and dehydrogenase)
MPFPLQRHGLYSLNAQSKTKRARWLSALEVAEQWIDTKQAQFVGSYLHCMADADCCQKKYSGCMQKVVTPSSSRVATHTE